jgi:hypothetical protein
MKKIKLCKIACLLFLLLASRSYAQNGCDCVSEFDEVKKTVEENYPGYDIKIKNKEKAYATLKNDLRKKASRTTSIYSCHQLLKEYLAFFRDKHMNIQAVNVQEQDDSSVQAFYKTRFYLEAESLPLKLTDNMEKGRVEGVYYSADSTYTISIQSVKSAERDYVGVLISSKSKLWKEGQVKLQMKRLQGQKFSGFIYGRKHDRLVDTFLFDQGSITGQSTGTWTKKGLTPLKQVTAKRPIAYEFRTLNEKTNYLRLSDFDATLTNAIDSFIQKQEAEIASKPYLIIDIRNNGGGSTRSYSRLIPYIYTKPVITAGHVWYATPGNIAAFRQYSTLPGYPESTRKWVRDVADTLSNHTGTYHVMGTSHDTFTLKEVLPFPQKIIVLMDKGVGSSAESFLLFAEQSDKTVLMGENSSGTIDYVEQVFKDLSCANFTIRYPIKRSLRLPQRELDNIGIAPHVKLPGSTDWIKAAMDHLGQ